MVVGQVQFFHDLFAAVHKRGTDSAPDFITLDSADGGTGAAPQPLMDYMGMPLKESLPLVVVLVAVIIVAVALFHRRLLALCLDEEYAWLQGVNVEATFIVLLVLVALTVVVLIHLVGVMPCEHYATIPQT